MPENFPVIDWIGGALSVEKSTLQSRPVPSISLNPAKALWVVRSSSTPLPTEPDSPVFQPELGGIDPQKARRLLHETLNAKGDLRRTTGPHAPPDGLLL